MGKFDQKCSCGRTLIGKAGAGGQTIWACPVCDGTGIWEQSGKRK